VFIRAAIHENFVHGRKFPRSADRFVRESDATADQRADKAVHAPSVAAGSIRGFQYNRGLNQNSSKKLVARDNFVAILPVRFQELKRQIN
jgi:hypothetical protein